MKSRIIVIFIGILVLWSALLIRAGYLQFLPNDRLQNLQNRQFQTKVTLPSRRGAIVDRNGRDLALSMTTYSLYADPKILEGRKAVARKLSKVLNQSTESIYAKIKNGEKRFVWIQRLLDKDKADIIKSWDIRGLAFVEEWRRVYPNENLFSQTLGYMGIEGQALEGLELKYDKVLRGNEKKVSVLRDARGRPLIRDGLMFTENPDGHELRLTMDYELQYSLESELQKALTEFEAESAVGVILDPKTSAILALASAPSFDVNKAKRASPEDRRNKAVTDVFEPGSTLKAFVIASALRDNLIQPNSKFYCEKGKFKVGNRIIREADSHHRFEDLTVAEILAVSSNIGTTKIAFKMGAEKLRQGLLDFGFGQRTGVDLPGEGRGLLHALPWRPHLLSNVSFGHGISATPLQMANAFAAIANGGVLNRPYIVESIRDGETGRIEEIKPQPIRRVLTPEQAAQMRAMLLGVTTGIGTGKNARVDGYMVAGKTGTAQKVNPHGRGYLKGAYISSFGGFVPANDPRFVIYVAVDSPKKSYYGGTVSAPIFARLASYALRKEGVAPLMMAEESTRDPKVKRTVASVKRAPLKQVMTAEELIQASEVPEGQTVPNLLKLSTREVLRRVSGADIKVKFVGQGLVSEVSPAVGSPLPSNRRITVILK